jgi:hypothetical protein
MKSFIGRRLIRIATWILYRSSDANLKAENMKVTTFRRKTGETNIKGRDE